jgi:6-phosphogluconate dehydrogenase
MKLGFIGLGKMGYNMTLNLLDHGHKVVAYNRSTGPLKKAARKGAMVATSIDDLITKLPKPRIVWIMITAGKPVDSVIQSLLGGLSKGDIIIDGGNSYFKDSQRRHAALKKKGIHYLDCGVSGGMDGARTGACMMIGGDKKIFTKVEKLFRDQCVKKGYGYMGSAGGGHYVKMIHNAIEYGMIGAIAEGMCALKDKQKSFGFDFSKVLEVYSHGSIVESRLVSWLAHAWKKDAGLTSLKGTVPFGGTEQEMTNLEKFENMPILHQARLMRAGTRKVPTFCGKVISAIRHEFGGHPVNKK